MRVSSKSQESRIRVSELKVQIFRAAEELGLTDVEVTAALSGALHAMLERRLSAEQRKNE